MTISVAGLMGIGNRCVLIQSLSLESLTIPNWNNWNFSNHILFCYSLKRGEKGFFMLCHSGAGFSLCKKQLQFREKQCNMWNGKITPASLEGSSWGSADHMFVENVNTCAQVWGMPGKSTVSLPSPARHASCQEYVSGSCPCRLPSALPHSSPRGCSQSLLDHLPAPSLAFSNLLMFIL